MDWRLKARLPELVQLLERIVPPETAKANVLDLANFLLVIIDERADQVPTHHH